MKEKVVNSEEVKEFHTPSCGIFFKKKKVLYKQKSPYQEIMVIDNEYFGKVLLLDGLVQTTEKDEFFYHELLIHPAMITHPSPEKILIIGGGDGGALKEVLRYSIKKAYLVEIDPSMIEVSKKYFPWLGPCLEDERVELINTDGQIFIEQTEQKFDVVIIDISDPVGPSFALHQKDFYFKLKKCLKVEAVVVAQIGSPFFDLGSIIQKNKFFREIFTNVYFYLGPTPTYPGGSWCYAYLSNKISPFKIRRDPPSVLKYFNPEIHHSAFALPNFMKEFLGQ
ncbi:MAG: polyamine aminopropyltransferase [Candidatus Aminicenantales bacterium]